MKVQDLRVTGAAFLLVVILATMIPGSVTAQARLAPADFDCSTATGIPPVECQALVALYTGTNGAGWYTQTGWLTTNTPCSWYGVTCVAGHVTSLLLFINHLSGSIPPQLGDLANLQDLELDHNQLSGSIPPQLGLKLANLQKLDLSSNQLRGALPQSMTNILALQYFYFDTGLLCLPDNPDFAAWFSVIPYKSVGGTTCTIYLPAVMRQ